MATIDDLNTSITEMSDEELQSRMLDLRKSRRVNKKPTKTKTIAKPKQLSIISLMGSMSEEDKAELIRTLEGT